MLSAADLAIAVLRWVEYTGLIYLIGVFVVRRLSALSPQQVRCTHLAGETVQRILSHAPGNDAPIGGVKVIADGGWFAARPSGTEDIYKIYAESFREEEHLRRIVEEAQAIVDDALRANTRGAES